MWIAITLLLVVLLIGALVAKAATSPRVRWQVLTGGVDQAIQKGDWGQAELLAKQAAKLAEGKTDAPWPVLTAATQLRLGRAFYRQGRIGEARRELEAGLEALNSLGEAATLDAALALSVLADCHLDQGDYEGACQHCETAIKRNQIAANPAMSLFHLQRLNDALLELERPSQAVEAMEKAVEIERGVLVEGSKPGEVVNYIAMSTPDLRFAEGKWEEAVGLFREKANYWGARITDLDNIDVGRYQQKLGESLARLGRYAEAGEAVLDAANTYRRNWSAEHPRVALNLARLAECLWRTGDIEGARRRAMEALAMLEAKQLGDHPWAVRVKPLAGAVSN